MEHNVLNIENIRRYVQEKKIYWTLHCLNRMSQRNILIVDVKNAIETGKIIEYYLDDYPSPSCLVMGVSIDNKNIHVVCSINDDLLYIITAYYPDKTKWESDMEARRKIQ